jgi:hypothetical protein
MAGQLGMGDAALFLVPRWRDRIGLWFGWMERIGLGTSIVLVPLHNPMHLAKEVATLQELSAAGDLGRRQLGARDPAGARAWGCVASVTRLRRRAPPPRQGAASGVTRDPARRGGARRRDLAIGVDGAVVQFADEAVMRDFARRRL